MKAALVVLLFSVAALARAELSSERLVLRTTVGDLVIALYPKAAPNHVAQVLKLARLGVYDHTPFSRIDPTFMVQVGGVGRRQAPLSAVQQQALQLLKAEFHPEPHRYGTVTMARDPDNPDSAESSFLILLTDMPEMDGKFTVVGKVVEGLSTLEALKRVPTDAFQKPVELVEIREAIVVSHADKLRELALDLRAPEPERLPQGFTEVAVSLTGVGLTLLLLSFVLLRRWLRVLGTACLLCGFFGLFTALAPSASQSSPLALGLFVGALALFKTMTFFERGRE